MQFFAIKDIGDINFNALVKDLPGNPSWNPFSTQGQYVSAILKSYGTFKKYGITNALRLAHFLAQGLIETGFLRYKAENLNYSAEGLLKIFPKYFTPEEAKQYARKPEKIANRVYGNRMGNGDEASGDGWRYRGRGFFQLTGKDNYARYGEMAGVDLVRNPDILEKDLTTSVKVAAAFFGKTGLGEYADRNDAAGVSRGVNRGNPDSPYKAHGEAERVVWTQKVLSLVKNPDRVVNQGAAVDKRPSLADGLTLGDRGPLVREIQEKLRLLSYPVGAADGIFGQNTRRAVLAFQDEFGLEPNGVVDHATADAINEALEDTRRTQPVERELANEADVRRAGARDIGKANEVGGAGAVAGGAGAVAAANEAGLVEPVVEAVTDALTKDDTDAPTTDAPEAATDTDTPDTVPSPDIPEEDTPTTTPVEASTPEGSVVTDDDAPQSDTPMVGEPTTVETGTLQPVDVDAAAPKQETDFVLMGILIAVALIGFFIWMRSRGIVEDKVDDYRSGRYL